VTLRATVRVLAAGHREPKWLTVSVVARADGPTVVERAGTLRELAVTPDEDRIVVGFRGACGAAGRAAPAALHVRASSQIPVGAGLGASAAATGAGAIAANALLGLDLDVAALAALIAGIDGRPDQAEAVAAGHWVAVRSECVDAPDGAAASW
jgi:homoserine kinase